MEDMIEACPWARGFVVFSVWTGHVAVILIPDFCSEFTTKSHASIDE
jgi:hypothetical protein